MVDENFKDEPGRLSRAFAVPARAVSRMRAGDARVHKPSAPEREAIVDCALYLDGIRQQSTAVDYREALAEARREHGAFVWLGLHAPTSEQMKGIADAFGLHELAVEDVVTPGQRPKLEQFNEVALLALRPRATWSTRS
jgi:magnesium transporter